MSLEGKTVIVTGAASGIGAETAKLMKERGAKVIGFDLNEPAENVDEYIYVNLADEASIEEAVGKFEGGADALCNVAGIPPTKPAPLVLQVNFLGLRKFTEMLIPKLNDGASIISVASVAGSGWPNNVEKVKKMIAVTDLNQAEPFCEENEIDAETSYNFSKECVIVWTKQNFYTWKERGIRINTVSPGPVETPILPDFIETLGRAAEDLAIIDRVGRAPEIAPAIAFLADPDSVWVNGTDLQIDGGLFAGLSSKIFGI